MFFTRDIENYTTDIIRRTAIAHTMLGRMLLNEGSGITFVDHVASRMEVLQEKQRRLAKKHFLVHEHHSNVKGSNADDKEEFASYMVYFDGRV